ncbi:hypothetical protein N9948_01505 [bacterium]|nr:hypothetical protein [bacterium]
MIDKDIITKRVIRKVRGFNKSFPKYLKKFFENYYEAYFKQIDKKLKVKVVKASITKNEIEFLLEVKGGDNKYTLSANYQIKHLDMTINGRSTGVNTWTDVFKKIIKKEGK